MKTIDITEKLNFEEKPTIKIKDTVIEVNNKAADLLKIIDKLDEPKPEDLTTICDVIFSKEDNKKIKAFNLSFVDFLKVVFTAINLVMGGNESGEAQTRTTI